MRNEEDIKALLGYIQTTEEKEVQFDEEAIAAAYQKNNDNQSVAIKILSVFGGLLASIAFIGFIFIAGLGDSETGMTVFGTLCIAGAIWINKAYDKIIIDTVSVSFFAIGFILLCFGLFQLNTNDNIVSIICTVIAVGSLMIAQNYILSFISVLIINGSILTLVIANDAYNLIHLYVAALVLIISYSFLREAKIIGISKALSKLYNPMRTGLIVSLLLALILLSKKEILRVSPDYIWLSSVPILAAIIFLLSDLFAILNITKIQHKAGVYIFSVVLLLPTVLSPGISGALFIILLSFWINYKTGFVLGVIAFIYFVSQYYYDLNFTLLTKSILMLSTGVLFIILYLFTRKNLTVNEKI